MKILNIILSLLIALMAGSCVYPEDVLEEVSVSISGDADESGITVYGKLTQVKQMMFRNAGLNYFTTGRK